MIRHRITRAVFSKLLLPLQLFALAMTLACPNLSFAAANKKTDSRETPFIGQTQISATIMRSFRPIGVFQVDMGILVTSPAQRARAAALQPVLRDAWRRTTQEFANSYFMPGKVPDAVLLGQRLQSSTDQVLGVGSARLLLIGVIVR